MSDTEQAALTDRYGIDPTEQYGAPLARLENELDRWNLRPDAVGKTVEEVPAEWLGNLYRWQIMDEWWYYKRPPGEDETEIAPIQFRIILLTVGTPPQELTDHLADVVQPRQRTLHSNAETNYWIDGYGPFESRNGPSVEGPKHIGLNDLDDERHRLCVPIYETEIYDEDRNLENSSKGYVRPFDLVESVDEPAPQQVKWRVRYNPNRRGGTYELAPTGTEAQRLSGIKKTVSLNGQYIGQLQAPRARGVYLADEYATADGTFKDQNTGMQMYSRQTFIDDGLFHPNALRKGGAVWKVRETEDHIALVATKPADWNPDEVAIDATGEVVRRLQLTETTPTTFDIRDDDISDAYVPPTTREIERGTEFEIAQTHY